MDATPKLSKRHRSSLSIGNRFKQRKHCNESRINLQKNFESDGRSTPGSPNIFNVVGSERLESTPSPAPRKFDLDDSLDYSPQIFDQSPTDCLSQSFGTDAPDVVWSWGQCDKEANDKSQGELKRSITTDSGFGSAGSSVNTAGGSTVTVRRTRSARLTYIAKRDETRKAAEAKLRQAEKERTEAMVREQYEKLQKKLMDKQQNNNNNNNNNNNELTVGCDKPSDLKATMKNNNNTLDDFFDDSDTDCLLLEATQKLEVAMPAKSVPLKEKPIAQNNRKTIKKNPEITTTPKSSNHDPNGSKKQSSFFMQFLEDDGIDDLFASIDDNWLLQATQSTAKPRSPFQRYKSMPVASMPTRSKPNVLSAMSNGANGASKVLNSTAQNRQEKKDCVEKNFKRHSSSHAFSPTYDRDQRAKLRK